jgi:hypothetical protein
VTTRAHDDLLTLARLEAENAELREWLGRAARQLARIKDEMTFWDGSTEQVRSVYGAAEDALQWLEDAPAGRKEKCVSSEVSRRPSGWLVSGACFGWFGGSTYAVTAWGGMPWPSVAFWIYAFGMLGALLIGGWLGWREGRGR